MWNPQEYLKFQSERDRPFFDLLAQVQGRPQRIADLGCGTGHLTAVLLRRWPQAEVVGVDSSPEMLAQAQRHLAPQLRFVQADLQRWSAPPLDLVMSNAALQWVPHHPSLLAQLSAMVVPGGELAFQVPGNFDAPSHTLLAELCAQPQWRSKVGPNGAPGVCARPSALSPAEYADLLSVLGFSVNAWESTYLHLLPATPNAVLEWVKGTALRPALSQLSAPDAEQFLGEYAALLSQAYPLRPYGTPFPFRRVFVVARRDAPQR